MEETVGCDGSRRPEMRVLGWVYRACRGFEREMYRERTTEVIFGALYVSWTKERQKRFVDCRVLGQRCGVVRRAYRVGT